MMIIKPECFWKQDYMGPLSPMVNFPSESPQLEQESVAVCSHDAVPIPKTVGAHTKPERVEILIRNQKIEKSEIEIMDYRGTNN